MMPSGLWGPVVLGAAIRIALWAWVPASRFASDEQSYFRAGTALATQGLQDLFWPPMTGWLIALVTLIAGPSVSWLRLVWVLLDIGCLIAVRSLAWRIAPAVSAGLVDHQTGQAALARQFTTWATLGYAIYLPAVSFSQFTTSETPALLQLLVVLLLLTRYDAGRGTFLMAGVITGTLALTRPSLLPLLVFLPIAIVTQRGRTDRLQHAALVAAAGALVVGAVVIKNWLTVGEATIARNSAYNLYIGNRDFYAEDLDLFSPRATREQIEFRRQFFSGKEAYPTGTPQQLQRQALAWIAEHPRTFARRALGRLGRVFAPRTDVLELVGGERAAGVFSPQSIALLGIANVQWAVVLFGGIIGLLALRHLDRRRFLVVAASVAGSLVLCLIAISKPRYSFVIDPLLLLGACTFLSAPGRAVGRLSATDRWLLVALFAFLIWAWIAWSIFAISSRTSM
jgi:4-amino-4-deoxy-L-arabinose transferase-like glycosyltransferase